MKTFEQYIRESVDFRLGGKTSKGYSLNYKYFPTDKDELSSLMEKLRKERGEDADFNDIDISKVTDISWIFCREYFFSGDISQWDTSNVVKMHFMFCRAEAFNRDISMWDTSKVSRMDGMFYDAKKFNQDISGWNTSKVINMSEMFRGAKSFNQDISCWNVKNAAATGDMKNMFFNCPIEEKFKPKFNKS